MTGMAFVKVAVEEIVAPGYIPATLLPSRRAKIITFQRKTEGFVGGFFFWNRFFQQAF
jgi:hypothetical protein